MPLFHSSPDLEMHYEIDDFTDPWTTPETILMVHGNRESGAAWYGWVPTLARRYRVVRPDTRGFGKSTPMPRDFPWTLDRGFLPRRRHRRRDVRAGDAELHRRKRRLSARSRHSRRMIE